MREFLSTHYISFSGILWLAGVAVQVSGFISPLVAYVLWAIAFGWLIWAVVSYRRAKKSQKVIIKPFVQRRQADWDKTEHLMWAELQVTNTGSAELKDVQVNIAKCLTLQETQDSPNHNDFAVFDFLRLTPFCVYWSERQSQPRQMALSIPRGSTRSALIAFQDNSNGGSFHFNTTNYNWVVGGIKIDVEVSSCETVLWKGEFYIECHPNYLGRDRAKFELTEWHTWIKGKNINLLDEQSLQLSKCD
jgi:hypothetical protein